ncbi:hypothetical protein AB0E62_31600 [Streptomyces sp. NPDC038707]|uniref:hypothetical protein n=1 Tax=Streptomyces sp. NPDC038707 TaxID=3154329 RepID=UPI0033E8B988
MHHQVFRALAARPGPVFLHEYNNIDYYLSCWDRLPPAEQDRFLTLAGRHLGHRFDDREALNRYLDARPELDPYSMDMGVESIAIGQATEILVHSAEAHHVLARRYPQVRIQCIPFGVHPTTPPYHKDLLAAHGLPPGAFVSFSRGSGSRGGCATSCTSKAKVHSWPVGTPRQTRTRPPPRSARYSKKQATE